MQGNCTAIQDFTLGQPLAVEKSKRYAGYVKHRLLAQPETVSRIKYLLAFEAVIKRRNNTAAGRADLRPTLARVGGGP